MLRKKTFLEVSVLKIKKVGIIANIEKDNIAGFTAKLKKWLEDRRLKVLLEANIAVAVGTAGFEIGNLASRVDLIAVLGLSLIHISEPTSPY